MNTIISFIKKLLKKSPKKQQSIEQPKSSTKQNNNDLSSATIVTREKHKISKVDVSENALKVLNRLTSQHQMAYLVGGSVRDLYLGLSPKDFDIATNAEPNLVRRLFKNSRIIGRRFKLVHVLFYRDVLEVATFRKEAKHAASGENKTNQHGMVIADNAYGSIQEDVWRRDLTINALYYDHKQNSIIDFVGGVEDLNKKQIRMIGNPSQRYEEDPVRILRVIRFASKLNFSIEEKTKQAIPAKAPLLANVSSSRLFEEVVKLFHTGNAVDTLNQLLEEDLFKYLFPLTEPLLKTDENTKSLINYTLESTDSRIANKKPVTPAFFFAAFLWPALMVETEHQQEKGLALLVALEKAMNIVLAKQSKHVAIPKRFTQAMREMWVLQLRLPKRFGIRAYKILEHPRFRAAYDFLLIRTLAGEESPELAQWWTTFQEMDEIGQKKMINQFRSGKKKNLPLND